MRHNPVGYSLEKNQFYEKQWHMLLIYDIYRLVTIALLFGVLWFDLNKYSYSLNYFFALFAYLVFGFIYLVAWYGKSIRYEQQVLWSGIVDIVALVLIIYFLGYLETGLGILLNASIAVLSILVPGRIAIFFAALASCLLIGIGLTQYFYGNEDNLSMIFSTGIYGTGFFATALTSWYLASWVRSSEALAQHRGKELASLQRLNTYIVERLQYGVIYISQSGKIQIMNRAAKHLLMLDEQARFSTLEEVAPRLYEKYQQFLSKKHQAEQTAQAFLESPNLKVHFYAESHVRHAAVLMILDDMSAIEQQAQQLKLASLGQFSASIAHELRNPLGVIAHAVQLMGEESHFNVEDQRLKELIINNCNRMNRVIKNVLQLTRRQQSKPESIELGHFLKQFKQNFFHINVCTLEIQLAQMKNCHVIFDKSQLEQVLIILCDNALLHGKDVQGDVRITMTVMRSAGQVKLVVSDNGSGIPQSNRDSIFDPFFSTLPTGNGMGLFIAKDLCEINQASLRLDEGCMGAVFQIYFNRGREMIL